jgi:hypothetical protein
LAKFNKDKYQLYHIYVITSDIDIQTGELLSKFKTIYVGSTQQRIRDRFYGHRRPESPIGKLIHKYGDEHFQMHIIITVFTNYNGAHKIEEFYTIQILKTNKLLNYCYGNTLSKELRIERSKTVKKYLNNINGEKLVKTRTKIYFEDKLYESVTLAAKELNLNRNNLYGLLRGHSKQSQGLKIKYIDKSNDIPICYLERVKEGN